MKLVIQSILYSNFRMLVHSTNQISQTAEKMFHQKRSKVGYSKEESYDGYNNCGAMCMSIYTLLKNAGINCDVYKSSIGYGKHLEDHVYLLYDGWLIDPTYKQFLRDERGIDDDYQKKMYDELDTFYIGEKNDLLKIFRDMSELNEKTYNFGIIDIEELEYFWKNPICITEKYESFNRNVSTFNINNNIINIHKKEELNL